MKINFALMKINFALIKINFALMKINFALMKINFAIIKIDFALMKINFALIEIYQLYTNRDVYISIIHQQGYINYTPIGMYIYKWYRDVYTETSE